jgi:glycosyltransferase involved in cell wall biosynthesis
MRPGTLGVVVPTIGDRPELRRLLESVIAQKRQPQAVCVVVDASDTTMVDEIVEGLRPDFGDIAVQVTSTGAHREEGAYLVETGYGVAVNAGLALLDTEFVAFLDDDDVILPEHFEKLEQALDPTGGTGFAYSRVLVVSVDGRERHYQTGPLPTGRFSAFTLIGAHPVLLPAALIHRPLIDRLGGMDESLDRKADTDLLIRLGAATDFASVDDASYVYFRNPHGPEVHHQALTEMATLIRKHQGSMTRKERLRSWDSLVRSTARAGLDDLSKEAAHEMLGNVGSKAPRALASLYSRVRRVKAPGWFRGRATRKG